MHPSSYTASQELVCFRPLGPATRFLFHQWSCFSSSMKPWESSTHGSTSKLQRLILSAFHSILLLKDIPKHRLGPHLIVKLITPSDWSVDWCLLQVSWQSSQRSQNMKHHRRLAKFSGSRCVDNFTQHIRIIIFTKLVDSIAPTAMCKEKNVRGGS